MAAVAIRNLNNALSSLQLEIGGEAPRARTDAQLGVKELKVLREVDMVAPAEMAQAAEPLVEAYRGNVTNGDELRLPRLTNLEGPAMRAAVGRVLAAGSMEIAAGSEQARNAERRMLNVLGALESAVASIQQNASQTHRG